MVAGLQQQFTAQQVQGAATVADGDGDVAVGVEPESAAIGQGPVTGVPGSRALCLQAALFPQPVQAEQGDRADAERAAETAKRAAAAAAGGIERGGRRRCRQGSE